MKTPLPGYDVPLHIVVIDDNADDRDLAMRELRKTFPQALIEPVGNAATLEQVMTNGGFDILITDYQLRWADGIEVVRDVKARYPECPVIMFTNTGNEEIAVTAMKAGLDDYILKKPSYFVRLPLAVRSAVERAQAQRRATEALAAREQFLVIAAHELRTPLTTVGAVTHVLTKRVQTLVADSAGRGHEADGHEAEATPARDAEWVGGVADHPGASSRPDTSSAVLMSLVSMARMLTRAQREVARLNRFVDDLLDVARLQRNELTLMIRDMDICSTVEDAVEAQRIIDPARAITFEPPAYATQVRADADRIVQVVANYLTNACRFTTADVPVTVTIEATATEVRVSVHDAGPGIAPDELERIWQPYYRVDGLTHRSGSSIGLGLGLYTCKSIVEQQGGHVGVESALGTGATFWFTLPLQQPESAATAQIPVADASSHSA